MHCMKIPKCAMCIQFRHALATSIHAPSEKDTLCILWVGNPSRPLWHGLTLIPGLGSDYWKSVGWCDTIQRGTRYVATATPAAKFKNSSSTSTELFGLNNRQQSNHLHAASKSRKDCLRSATSQDYLSAIAAPSRQ